MHCNRWRCFPSLCINYGLYLCIKNWFLMGARHKAEDIYHLDCCEFASVLTYSTSSISVSLPPFCSDEAAFLIVQRSSRGLYSGQVKTCHSFICGQGTFGKIGTESLLFTESCCWNEVEVVWLWSFKNGFMDRNKVGFIARFLYWI